MEKNPANTAKYRLVPAIVISAFVGIGCSVGAYAPADAATVTTITTFGTKRRDVQRPTSNVTVFRGAFYGITLSAQIYQASPKHDKARVAFQASGDEYYQSGLVECDAAVYGVVPIDDDQTYVIVKVDPVSHVGSIVYTFPDNGVPGLSLACSNSKLYGGFETLARRKLVGSLFSFDPASATYTNLHTQTAEEGTNVESGLTAQAGILYGAAEANTDKPNPSVNVYSFDPSTGQETILHRFRAGSDIGSGSPAFPVLVHGNDIFGFTDNYDTDDVYLYRVHIKSGSAKLLYEFNFDATGAYPNQSVIFQNGLLYGTLAEDNAHPLGTVYSLDPATGAFTTVYAFTGGTDGNSPASGLTLAHGVIYGTTSSTNAQDREGGTIFKLTP